MNHNLLQIKTKVYDKCALELSGFEAASEGKEYHACRYQLSGRKIISRSAKVTPKKVGQFVTFWKRNNEGLTAPFDDSDQIDFYVVNVRTENNFGQFVFPKSVLIKKGIISTQHKEGKRAFRVYPCWDAVHNKQAERTQKWQLNYFYEINDDIDFNRVMGLFEI